MIQRTTRFGFLFAAMALLLCTASIVQADVPAIVYIFPAGAQRGTTVDVRVGGFALHEGCPFEMQGPGVNAAPRIERIPTLWFEGPMILTPESQGQEDYPSDYRGQVSLAADAPLGPRAWRVSTSQGAVASRSFQIGTLPEIVEQEIDGEPLPVNVALPLTINGRIFPREDIDVWTFTATAGEPVTCSAVAAKLGSPFDVRFEVCDARGQRIADSRETPTADAFVRFTPPSTGTYQVRVTDAKSSGLQSYVYRLSLTNGPWIDAVAPLGGSAGSTVRLQLVGQHVPAEIDVVLPATPTPRWHATLPMGATFANPITLAVGDLPEVLETEPNDVLAAARKIELPTVVNGRIDRPGDVDVWAVSVVKGTNYEFDVQAARLGSPLDSVLVLLDADGKELARADDHPDGSADSFLRYQAPADGTVFLRVEDRFESRGGPAFAYRLRVSPGMTPDFRLETSLDALTVNRAGEGKLRIKAERTGGFNGEIKLSATGLPAGVTLAGETIPAGVADFDVTFKADAAAAIAVGRVQFTGQATINEQPVSRVLAIKNPALGIAPDDLLLAVALQPPFKVVGTFELKYAHRGGTMKRHFKIERGGFVGPFDVGIAERQSRHLQGVTGPALTVPAGVDEFEFEVVLPPNMEVGRTSRTCVTATGVHRDADGSEHKLSATSLAQNEQIVILVDGGQLSVDVAPKAVVAAVGQTRDLAVRITRGPGPAVPVLLELVVPAHIQGVAAEPVTLAADKSQGTVRVKFADSFGPLNMPVLVRARTMGNEGPRWTAEIPVRLLSTP